MVPHEHNVHFCLSFAVSIPLLRFDVLLCNCSWFFLMNCIRIQNKETKRNSLQVKKGNNENSVQLEGLWSCQLVVNLDPHSLWNFSSYDVIRCNQFLCWLQLKEKLAKYWSRLFFCFFFRACCSRGMFCGSIQGRCGHIVCCSNSCY